MESRRDLFRIAGIAALMPLGAGLTLAAEAAAPMSPNEDLMQEHALLNRVLLMYDEAILRLKDGSELDPKVVSEAAGIVRHFVEEYHEKLEETYVFPRFEKAGKLVDLVATLRAQHQAGRDLTDAILSLTAKGAYKSKSQREKLSGALGAFTRMYRPHETREGSVLFPAFRDLVPPKEFEELGNLFEKKEHELLGAAGFEGQVKVAEELEKKLGLYDLGQYTPKKTK